MHKFKSIRHHSAYFYAVNCRQNGIFDHFWGFSFCCRWTTTRITNIRLKIMLILGILGHFCPVFGLSWPRYKFLKVLVSILFLFLSGLSEIGKKILNNNDELEESADFGHFRPFLACFWPVMALV